MSTLKVENLQHKDAVSPNLVLNSDGSITAQSYIGDGSQLTGISSYSDSDLVSYLGANDIGIGKTNPSYPLDVDVGAPASTDKTIARFSSESGVRDIGFVWDDSASTMGIATLTNHAMVFHTNGNSNPRMIIDTSGYVTTPSQPAWFYAGGTSLTTSTYVVTKPGTAYISSPHYNTSTGLFTAPISGNYLVGVEGLVYPHGGNVMTNRWQKNGAQYGHVIQSGGENNNHTHLSWTQLVYLSQNDTIGFAINRSGGSENAYGSQWHQWGYLVG